MITSGICHLGLPGGLIFRPSGQNVAIELVVEASCLQVACVQPRALGSAPSPLVQPQPTCSSRAENSGSPPSGHSGRSPSIQ